MSEEEVYTKPEEPIIKPKKFNKKLIIIPIVIIFLFVIIALYLFPNLGLESSLFTPLTGAYKTFSDGIILEYPSNWYTQSDEYTKSHSLPPNVYSNSKYDGYNGAGANVEEYTISNNVTSAIEDIERNAKNDTTTNGTVKIISIEDDVGTIKISYFWPPRNVTLHFLIKIIKCNEKLFKLTVGAAEPFDSEYDTEIEHLISSFRCK